MYLYKCDNIRTWFPYVPKTCPWGNRPSTVWYMSLRQQTKHCLIHVPEATDQALFDTCPWGNRPSTVCGMSQTCLRRIWKPGLMPLCCVLWCIITLYAVYYTITPLCCVLYHYSLTVYCITPLCCVLYHYSLTVYCITPLCCVLYHYSLTVYCITPLCCVYITQCIVLHHYVILCYTAVLCISYCVTPLCQVYIVLLNGVIEYIAPLCLVHIPLHYTRMILQHFSKRLQLTNLCLMDTDLSIMDTGPSIMSVTSSKRIAWSFMFLYKGAHLSQTVVGWASLLPPYVMATSKSPDPPPSITVSVGEGVASGTNQ